MDKLVAKFGRLQIGLAALLAVQVVLSVVFLWPRQIVSASGQPLIEGIQQADVIALAITDDAGRNVQLAKASDQWFLESGGDYPADAAKVTPVLTKLLELSKGRLISKTPASQAQLKVADQNYLRRIEMKTSGGAALTLYLGSSAGGSATHVRLGGQNEVYMATGISSWDYSADASSWIDTVYLALPSADVVRFSLTNANGQWDFEKDGTGAWTMPSAQPDEQFNPESVSSLLSRFDSLRMMRPLGTSDEPSYGLAAPAALITVVSKSGDTEKSVTLAVGAKDTADSSYTVKSSESSYYVRVSEYSLNDFVSRTREGFLVAPATPTPAAASGS
jgi:hypothetical protein